MSFLARLTRWFRRITRRAGYDADLHEGLQSHASEQARARTE
jgi:hypothetical protein